MGAPDVLARVAAAGIRLTPLPDGRLWAEPSSKLTDELRSLIREHKAELRAVLTPEPVEAGGETPPVHPPISKASQAEITRLVRLFSSSLGFSQQDADEALQVALAHPESALDYYRREVARLGDPQVCARRTRVLQRLAENPEVRRAVLAYDPGEGAVLLTMAIRGLASFELRIPKDRYDPFLLLDLIERHCGTVH